MAKKYALKENKQEANFANIDEAKNYLETLAEKFFFHEVGHVIYAKMKYFLQKEWENFMKKYPDIEEKVIKVQKDNYNDEKQIPIADEAFADFSIDVLSNGRFISRLGENVEVTKKLKTFLKEI